MAIEDEDGHFKSTSVTHTQLIGPDLIREVRWYPGSGNAYRWSKRGNRWVSLGQARSLNYAKYLAEQDMYVIHSRR